MAQAIGKHSLSICHLYGEEMNTYGDNGNITTLSKRCQWREITVNVTKVGIGQNLKTDFDIFFFGGGQDKTQEIIGQDLKKKAKSLKGAIDQGAVLLSICGGYQLLQNYFKTKEEIQIPGIGIFDAYTQGSDDRMIQNLEIELSHELEIETKNSNKLIGFENHSGKTYLAKGTKPLGTVLKGAGNNGEDKTEGAIYKNAFGCYLHGSLLPKNPHFADYLISKALERKYGKTKLKALDDSIEWQAHKKAIQITRSAS